MNILVVYGTNRKKNTYTLVQQLLEKFCLTNEDKIEEIFTPELKTFCLGCLNCVTKGEDFCPHRELTKVYEDKISNADILIYASPVYVYSVTGSMKNFLDHFPYMWSAHRPRPNMKNKVGIVISDAAGAGTKTTNKVMYDNLSFYGVPKIYKFGINISASSIDKMSLKKKKYTNKKFNKIVKNAKKDYKNRNHLRGTFRQRLFFFVFKKLAKTENWNQLDSDWYRKNNWIK